MPRLLFCPFLCLIILILVAGCGKKANPVPWNKLRPEAIKDLDYRVVETGILLTWSVPTRNHDGSPLPQIEEFQLYKAVVPVDHGCAGCPPKFGQPIIIKFDDKPSPGQQISYEDHTVEPGFIYIYQVRSLKNFMNLSDPSNTIRVAWHSPPNPPSALSVDADESGIHLKWNAPQSYADGSPIKEKLRYKIWRKFNDEVRFTPIKNTISKTRYTDSFPRTYTQVSYKVTAVLEYMDTEIESSPSEEISLLARDIEIEMRPARLIAFRTAQGVELAWDMLYRPEIRGFFVYRKGPDGVIFRLNSVPLTGNSFTDISVLPPGRYIYWIVAVDDATPPRRTVYSKKVQVRITR